MGGYLKEVGVGKEKAGGTGEGWLLGRLCGACCSGVVVIIVLDGGCGNAVGLEDEEDIGFGEVEAQGFEGDFELVVVDVEVFV